MIAARLALLAAISFIYILPLSAQPLEGGNLNRRQSPFGEAGPSPTGRGACTLSEGSWNCATPTASATSASSTSVPSVTGTDSTGSSTATADAAGASPTGRGECTLHDDHWDCELPESGEAESEDSHAGHNHGPSAEYGCSLAPLEEYDLGLHIIALFVLLLSSSAGILLPIISSRFASSVGNQNGVFGTAFFIFRHVGTGIILSTALIHLLNHSFIYFSNECLGELKYEATAAAIVLAAVYVTFLIDFFIARRLGSASDSHAHDVVRVDASSSSSDSDFLPKTDDQGVPVGVGRGVKQEIRRSDVMILEAGIIFHSIMIGVTLGTSSGHGWKALFIAIVLHQLFEGLGLGSRIALIPFTSAEKWTPWLMAGAFGCVTSIGIAIGIGVRYSYNANSGSALLSIGILNAVSAGILLYTGMVHLLAGDWISSNSDMRTAPMSRVLLGLASLTVGLALMSLLGKWA